jgi:ATP synthase F0 subunit b
MQFDWWTFGLQAVNFLVLVALLHRFLYRPIVAGLSRRKQAIDKVFADSAAAAARAEEARRTYETEHEALGGERDRLLAAVRKQFEEERQGLLDKARAEADALIAAARDRIDEERAAALAELRGKVVELATELAAHLLRHTVSQSVAEALLERVTADLDHLPPGELASLRAQVASGQALQVVTAPALDAPAIERWRQHLTDRLGGTLRIDFATDERLIAGAELHFPHAVLRLSWRDVLDRARTDLVPHGVA